MNNGKSMFWSRTVRGWAIFAGVVFCVFVLWLVWWIYFDQPTNEPARPIPSKSVANQPLKPSSYQRTRSYFGPWHSLLQKGTGAPRLVMLHADGGEEVSSKTIRCARSWRKASAIQITTAVPESRFTVRILNTGDRPFNLRFGQAFVLAETPEAVYCYHLKKSGNAQLVSTTVTALKKR